MPFNSLFSLSLACSFYTPLALAARHVHPTVDVAVIGGGFSGLVAAKTLHAANKSVVVLEARDRVGGRVYDTHFPDGTTTYLGAQFVGPSQSNMVALAKELDVTLVPTFNTGSTVLYINSTRVKFSTESSATGELPIDAASLEQVAATETLLNQLATEIDPDAPWNHTKANEWDSQTFASWLDSKSLSTAARFIFNLATTTGFSDEPGVVSFLSTLLSISTARNETGSGSVNGITSATDGAEAMFCRDGCQSVAIKIASLLGPDRVKLNAHVRTIKQTQDGYEVETGNGTVIAKKVIVAMSPVMSGRIHYEPPLPAGRDQLSQRMPMGSVAKVIAKSDTPFWRADGLNGQAFSNLGFAVSTYDISPQDNSSGILLGFVAADQARSLDGKSKAEITDLVKKDFVNYFGPKANNATDWIVQQWDQEVYSRGGYNSNYLPGTITKYGKFVTEPFEGIHFAGVETARFWRGYMDGAISGGERAANEVIDALVAL